jgi:drug/metabolite transporter, DME family
MGPVFVAVAAALWGTETYWRVYLNKQFVSDVLVFYEHFYCLFLALPFLVIYRDKLKNVPLRAWLFLIGSGAIGSALGTFFFTSSLRTVNLTVANLLLNTQPIFCAVFASIILKERFYKGFILWAAVALIAGGFLSLERLSFNGLEMKGEITLVLLTAVCWGFATVAGRALSLDMSYLVASPLRFLVGLIAMGILVVINGHASPAFLNLQHLPVWHTQHDFLMLSFVAGVIPLFLYFKGLSTTPASVATFLEMFQIVAALFVTWGIFHQTLLPHQIIAAVVLIVAVYQINRIQSTESRPVKPHKLPESN